MKTIICQDVSFAVLPTAFDLAYMSALSPIRLAAERAGLYTETTDRAGHLSGAEYSRETASRPRYTLTIREFAVGDGVTLCGHSDRHVYTVIKRTKKTLTLRRDTAKLLNGFDSGESDSLQFSPGGFVGHTSGSQCYSYTPDENGRVTVARLTKRGFEADGKRVMAGKIGRAHV